MADPKPKQLEIIMKGTAGRTEAVRHNVDEAEVRSWMITAARTAADKTEAPTVVLDVGDVLSITSWFVITSARNSRLVKAIVDTIEEEIDLMGGPKPLRVEGLDSLEWVAIDYGDFVVHVFHDDTRAFYDLERLYRDVETIDWSAET